MTAGQGHAAGEPPAGDGKGVCTEARPLTAERFADLEAVFAGRGCSFARDCWCMGYRVSGKLTPPSGISPKVHRRAMLRALAEAEPPPGLVGYDRAGRPVGWVAVGPRAAFAKLARSRVMGPIDDVAVWSVVCFVVPSDLRGRGIADALLTHAVDHARRSGAPAVEGYPTDKAERSQPQWLWHGAKTMFDRAGFEERARRTPLRPLMRLDL